MENPVVKCLSIDTLFYYWKSNISAQVRKYYFICTYEKKGLKKS